MPATPYLPQLCLDFHSCPPVDLDFSAPASCPDGGLLLLRKLDDSLGFTRTLASLLHEARDLQRTRFSKHELLRLRVFLIALGYTDQNDVTALRHDPLWSLLASTRCGPDRALCSQPSLSRFEHAVSAQEVVALQRALEDDYVASLPDDTSVVVLDLDSTDDPTHGNQPGSFFNRYYDTTMYFPLLVFDHEGRLASVRLRAGNAGNNKYSCALIVRLVRKVKARFPQAQVVLRADSGFCNRRLLAALDKLNEELGEVDFLLGLERNKVLERLAASAKAAAAEAFASSNKPARVFDSFDYRAKSWPRAQRVVVKAEHLDKGANPRFIVTSLRHVPDRLLYENGYCGRGCAENCIKDFKRALGGDRLSDMTFVANALRLLLHAAAYRLLDGLRRAMTAPLSEPPQVMAPEPVPQMDTLRQHLLKVAAVVSQNVRRMKVSLPQAFAHATAFWTLARRLGGQVREVARQPNVEPAALAA